MCGGGGGGAAAIAAAAAAGSVPERTCCHAPRICCQAPMRGVIREPSYWDRLLFPFLSPFPYPFPSFSGWMRRTAEQVDERASASPLRRVCRDEAVWRCPVP